MKKSKTETWNGHTIRFVDRSGEWWAVAKDVCGALGLGNVTETLRNFPDDEILNVSSTEVQDSRGGWGGASSFNIVNETGLYRLIFQSRKPEAEAFKRWVFDIIKTLRKSLGLNEYEAFRLMDREHQKAAMRKLNESLREPVKVDYIKANMIADKAVATMHGFPKLVRKPEMDAAMLRDREPVLADTVELMTLNERFSLGLSVSEQVYRKYAGRGAV